MFLFSCRLFSEFQVDHLDHVASHPELFPQHLADVLCLPPDGRPHGLGLGHEDEDGHQVPGKAESVLQKAKQVSVRKSRDLLRLDVVQGDVDDRHRDQGQHRLADGLKVEQRLGLAVDGQDVAGSLGRLLDKLGADEDEDVRLPPPAPPLST